LSTVLAGLGRHSEARAFADRARASAPDDEVVSDLLADHRPRAAG
jgi:hypothetical protein